ncbi:MAG: hypothetical protein L3J93_03790, partial [Thermoplasmata archaeon]|nr:hypothetical protein [Thermoplasmata archaeon]
VVVSGALLFDALLVLFFPPSLIPALGRNLHSVYFLIFPLFGGLYLAAFGLWVKWEDYQLWPWETHFSWTLGSVVIDAILVFIYVTAVSGVGPTGGWTLLPAFYPLTLVGLTLPMVGLSLTWTEWSQRKAVAIGAAILPVPLALALYLPSLSPATQSIALALSLSASAVLYQTSGSFLHLIASGTRAHEREVIVSSQNRLASVAGQLRERDEALRFREATLIGREADVENAALVLERKVAAVEEQRAHATTLETDVQSRSGNLQRLQRELALGLAKTTAQQQTLEGRETALGLREKDHAARLPKLAEREQSIVRREGEIVSRESEVATRFKDTERRASDASELEARLAARQQEIDRKTAEVLRREASVTTRAAPATGTSAATAASLAESKANEARLQQLKETLDQQNTALGKRASETRRKEEEVEKRSSDITRKVEELRIREAEITRKAAEAAESGALATTRIGRYEEILRQLEQKTQAVETRSVLLSQKEEEAAQRESELAGREKSITDRTSSIERDRTSLERLGRDLSVKERQMQSLEDELRLQRQSIARGGSGTSPELSLAFAAASAGGPQVSRSLGRRRAPVGVPSEETKLPEVEPESLAAPTRTKFADRAATGTPRLDDLLLGGIPPSGHLMLIGDAFGGKEIALYAFLAQGLKNGDAAIIITAARAPDEVAQKIGLVAPQFHEYEQLGMVRWIDASIPETAPSRRAPTASRAVTKGPTDHAGILSSLVQFANAFDGGSAKGLRVAFLGLSATLGHADEAQRLPFVQNLVGVLKPRNAIAMYALESGTIPQSQLETVLSRMDGAIYFKTEGQKSFLSVQGVGDVETRDWVEYRATNRALVIGSFSLERIR